MCGTSLNIHSKHFDFLDFDFLVTYYHSTARQVYKTQSMSTEFGSALSREENIDEATLFDSWNSL